MIFSCWGEFPAWSFLAQANTVLCASDGDDDDDDDVDVADLYEKWLLPWRGDDAEVDDFTIWCNTGGMNAPNWIFTPLKCIANAPYFICIVMHFLLTHFANKIRTASARTKRQPGF